VSHSNIGSDRRPVVLRRDLSDDVEVCDT
jgi:hypothetical protein